uniref:Uncharacterized protein n=1 Tax=Anguilla anguilla TaxID=7936 RepID=A0A0E9W090_ANGAN
MKVCFLMSVEFTLVISMVPPHQPQGVLHDTTQNNTTPPPTSTPRHHMTQHRTTQQ